MRAEEEGERDSGNGDEQAAGEMSNESRSGGQHLNGNDEEIMKNDKEDGQIAIIADNKKYVEMSIWVWEAVLKFLTRMEMADRVSLVCHALRKLCWPRLHGNKVAPHMVYGLQFWPDEDENGYQAKVGLVKSELRRRKPPDDFYFHNEKIPIATGAPLPDYILGFKEIFIRNLDAAVVQFLRNIISQLTNVHLELWPYGDGYFEDFLRAFNGYRHHIAHLNISSISMREVRQELPGLLETIPAISAKIQHQEDCTALDELILAKIAIGKPFVIDIQRWGAKHPISFGAIWEAFRTATQPQSFLIRQYHSSSDGPSPKCFHMENEATGEMLALEHRPYAAYELYRCPRGDVQQWREQEAQKMLERDSRITFIKYWTFVMDTDG